MNQVITLRSLVVLLISALSVVICCAASGAEPDASESAAEGTDKAAAPPPPPKNPPLPLDLQRGKLLDQQFSQDKEKKASINWFRKGQKDAFLGLYTENYGREPQGYALILHDNQQHPDWPGIVHHLRSELPAKGWSTLAISLPIDWNLTKIPPRENEGVIVQPPGEAAAEEPDNTMAEASRDMDAEAGTPAQEKITYTQLSVEYPPKEIPNIIQGRVAEALQFLQGRDPMPIMVIAVGTSATYAARQVHTLRMKDIAGLVIVDPKAVEQEGFDVNSDAPGLRIPVLDMVPEFHPRSDPAARQRAATRNAKNAYEQQTISGATPGFNGYEAFLTKAIRGWAKRVIIDKKRFGYL